MVKWLSVSAVVFVLDMISKAWVQQHFALGDHQVVTSFFDLVRYHNTGAAFSFLADAGGWQQWFFVAISVIASLVIVYLLKQSTQNKLYAFGLALVLGGALGNLVDRITLGYVVDFLSFHYGSLAWPAFNVADSAICVGVAILLFDSFKNPTPEVSKT